MARTVTASRVNRPGIGESVGPYRLLELLGQGGVGLVFRAVHETSGRVVALKSARAPREGVFASIRREIRALEQLRHPGIVRILEGGVHDGVPWYAMDLLEGDTLRTLLRKRTSSLGAQSSDRSCLVDGGTAETIINDDSDLGHPVPPSSRVVLASSARPLRGMVRNIESFLTLIRRLCEPLAYIHGEGIVHRDLTPSNVFVLPNEMPVLMDFGLMWRIEGDGSRGVLSVEASRAGTVAYMAPEQARGEALDARSDLFSLGCIMYEALTGDVPFPARSLNELVAMQERAPAKPSSIAERIPRELDELVLGLLERNPRDRIGHAASVAATLADFGAAGWPGELKVQSKAYLYRPPLIGRDDSLNDALKHLSKLATAHGGCVFVGGVSGIGKTSFAFEVARHAALGGLRVITGECAAVGTADGSRVRRSGPLYPFIPVLQAVADRCITGGVDDTVALLGDRAKVLAIVEPQLRDLPGTAQQPEPPEVPSEAARRRLIDALADTLAALAAEQALLVVVEDLQWADEVTLAFLASLSPVFYRSHRVLILATFRSEETNEVLERVVQSPHAVRIGLECLDANALCSMASEMLAQRTIPHSLAQFLGNESSGNPFFVSEYLRAAVQAGLLFRDGRGSWRDAEREISIDGLQLPHNLHAIVSRRLETLPVDARRVAEVAAAVARDVDVLHLCSIGIASRSVSDDVAFEHSLRTLVKRQVLEPSAPGRVRFVHDKLREIAYEQLSTTRQRLLHTACAEFLERHHRSQGTLERASAVLAHHFERAGADRRALTYLDKAGEAAHAMHSSQEAHRLLSRAERLERKLGGPLQSLARARRHRLLGANALALGDMNGAFAGLTEAARAAGHPWPRTKLGLALSCVTALSAEIWRTWAPQRPSSREPLPELDRELLLEAARAYERLVVVTYWNANMLRVAVAASTNVGLAERAGGETPERALGYATFGIMCACGRLDAAAQSYCRRAVASARNAGDEASETWVLMTASVVHLQAARWRVTEEYLETSRAMARRIGFIRRWEEATTQLSTAHLLAGRFTQARRLNDELLGSIERADPQVKCWAVVRVAELALLEGRASDALASARDGERWCETGLARGEWVYTLGALALALLRSGDLDEAHGVADRCSVWIERGSLPLFYNIFAYAAVAEIYLALCKGARASSARRRQASAARGAIRRLTSIAGPMAVARPSASLWRGFEALTLDDDPRRAAHFFRQSAQRAERLGMAYDHGLALAALGEHVAAESSQKRRWLAEAAGIFRRIGAARDLQRIEGLLPRAH